MKKIMVIGAGVYQKPLIQAASRRGQVILVAPVVTEDLMAYVTKAYYYDVRDLDAILTVAKQEKVDAVVTDQTDIAVRTVAYVTEKMGLPTIGYDTACLFTDKYLMRKKMEELGIPVLPNRAVTNLEDALKFYRRINCPCILKPLDNQGSRGVTYIESEEKLIREFENVQAVSGPGMVIIEKNASGREFVVEGRVVDYRYQTLICGDTEYFDIPDAYAAKNRIFPSAAPQTLVHRVNELNDRIITGFGLKQGITHSEFIMDENEIYLIETAARGGGVFISSDLIHLGSGLETEEFLLDLALGEKIEPFTVKPGIHCGYMAFYLPNGTVQKVEGVKEVQTLPFVHRNLLDYIYPGLQIVNHTDKTSRFSIIVSGKSRRELDENMAAVRRILNIQTLTKSGLKPPIWE